MASVIFTGSDRVKCVIVVTYKAVSPLWVFPNPVLKRLLYHLLLCLRRRGFLMVQHRFFIVVFVINIVKDAGVTEIQGVLHDAVCACPLRAVSAVRLDIPNVGTLILSRLVDTFSSRILYPMLLLSRNHSIAVVLSWEEAPH